MGGGGTPDLGTSAFCHMSNSPGVVGLCTTRFDSVGGVHLTWVHLYAGIYLHSSVVGLHTTRVDSHVKLTRCSRAL